MKIKALKEKISKNFKDNKLKIILILVAWVVLICATLSNYSSSLGKESYGNDTAENITELSKGVTIEEIAPVNDETETIAIEIATYARKNKGTITIHVVGLESNIEYCNKETDISDLQDNAFLAISLDKPIESANDQTVKIILTSNSEKDSSIGIYSSNDNLIEGSSFLINGVEQTGTLTYKFLMPCVELNLFYRIVIIWVISGISILLLVLLLLKPKYEVFFTLAVAIIGIAFCAIMTPLSIPDETTHYEYSFQVSNYMMGQDHFYFDSDYQDYGSYKGHYNVSSAYKKVMLRFNSELSLDNNITEMNEDIEGLYAIPFIPQAIGITIARLLSLNRVKTFYLGRLFNLAFYTICVYLAIKKTPIHKVLFGIISILPMFVQQAASYSYDCFVNGLALVTIAYLLKFIFVEEKISKKEYIFILIVCLILAPEKRIYGFFSLLFWLVPASRYRSKKNKIIQTLLLNLSAVYCLYSIMQPVIMKIFYNISDINKESSYINQEMNTLALGESNTILRFNELESFSIGQILRNPLDAIMVVLRTIRYFIKNWFYDAFGRSLSGVTLILPTRLVYLFILPVFLASLLKEKYIETPGMKIAFIATCIIIGLFVIVGFMLSWTNVGQDVIDAYGGIVIEGIQGRYFSPLLPFLFTIFNNKKFNISRGFDNYIIVGYLFVIFEVMTYIMSYTFIN